MKRDPRLRRRGERVTYAHGGKYGRRPRYRATQTRADAVARIARALHLPPEILAPRGPSVHDLHDAFVRSLADYGNAFVACSWEDESGCTRYLRFDPEEILPTPDE